MNNTTRFSLSEASKQLIHQVFADMMESCHGITGLLISTVDGHVVSSLFRGETMQEARLAAMTSSLLALGESLSKEAKQDECKHIIVQNSDGVIVTQRFGKSLVLTSIADTATNLGMLHSVTRIGANKLAAFKKE
jgi:predicted regulator of Ras-like GTPase activity (Roadblock/LC7/MglB family)